MKSAEIDMALHALTHPRRKAKDEEPKKEAHPDAGKELSVTRLHDGSLHYSVSGVEGSTEDLDEVHDLLEKEFGEPNEGEEQEEHAERGT